MHISLDHGHWHLCYHLYNCLLLVGFFGGCLSLSLTLMTFYGLVGVESAIFLSSVGVFGLVRVLKRTWPSMSATDDDDLYYSITGNHRQKSRGRLLCELAVDTWTLGNNRTKDDTSFVCPDHRDSSCSICLQCFEVGQSISVVSTCQHAFHSECLQMWAQKSITCPYCRQDMEMKNPNEEESRNGERYRLPGALGIFEGQFDSIFDM